MTATENAPRTPGRPRSARADEAIIEAVLDMLAEGTQVDALSIEAVSARAGVGKATIYRRWAKKEDLLLDAIRVLKGPPPVPKGESVRDDLVALLGIVRQGDKRVMKIMPCLVPEVHRSPAHYRLYQEIVEERREVMREVLRRGIRDGTLRSDLDVDLTTLMLTAPVLVQRLVRWHPDLDERKLPEQVVDALLTGARA